MNRKSKTINILKKLAKKLYIKNKDLAGDAVVEFLDVIATTTEEPKIKKESKATKPDVQSVKTASTKQGNIHSKIENLKEIYSLALEHDDKRPFGRIKRGR